MYQDAKLQLPIDSFVFYLKTCINIPESSQRCLLAHAKHQILKQEENCTHIGKYACLSVCMCTMLCLHMLCAGGPFSCKACDLTQIDPTEAIATMCDGRTACTVGSEINGFGSTPCLSILKDTKISYTCSEFPHICVCVTAVIEIYVCDPFHVCV